jgi:hypothetical protein
LRELFRHRPLRYAAAEVAKNRLIVALKQFRKRLKRTLAEGQH